MVESTGVLVDSLEIEISSDSEKAAKGIDALSNALLRLRNAVALGSNLERVRDGIAGIVAAINTMNVGVAERLYALCNGLSAIGAIQLSSTLAEDILKLIYALTMANGINPESTRNLAEAIVPLGSIPTISPETISGLKELPKIFRELSEADLAKIRENMEGMANAIDPLVRKLSECRTVVDRLAPAINQLGTSMTTTTARASKFGRVLNHVLGLNTLKSYLTVRMVSKVIAGWIKDSNDYVEDVNLFTASMGKYAQEAKSYSNSISSALGIDPGEWMRNQGVFMTISKGFGVASDRAYTMSKNLTQLGYDLASFFNISTESAFQKLQAGLSGELEPLRRLGYDLSQARLKAEAAALGITKSFNKMTQAEKSQLRYYTIMKQVTNAQGDMARTLETPANQLRIFKAQLVQTARALGNIFIPALNMVLPYLTAFVMLAREAAEWLAKMMGYTFPEIDYGDATGAIEGIGDEADNATEAVKKLKKNMLGIDELNILGDNNTDDDLSDQFNFELPEYDFIGEAVKSKANDIVKQIKEWIWEILAIGAALMIVLGLILICTGANIPLGIGLVIAGAAILASVVAINWNDMPDRLKQVIKDIMWFLGGFLMVLGVILVVTGHPIWGIALMCVGAAALVAAAQITWGTEFKGKVLSFLTSLRTIIAGFLLVLGIIILLTVPEMAPLGVALVILGAFELAHEVALRWGAINDEVEYWLNLLEALVGGALMGIGLMLMFTGHIPLGLGIFITGALMIYNAVAPQWGAILADVENCALLLMGVVFAALFGIGVMMMFANHPGIGLALMLVGAAGVASAVTLIWGGVNDTLKGYLLTLMGIIGGALFAIGVLVMFMGHPAMGLALMVAGFTAVAAVMVVSWGGFDEDLKNTLTTLVSIIGPFMFFIGVLAMAMGQIPLGLALMVFGAATVVAAVAMGWGQVNGELERWLVNLATIVGPALFCIGVLLLFMNQIPLGLALMVAGAAVTYVAFQWGAFQTDFEEQLRTITLAVSGAAFGIGVALLCMGHIPMGLALMYMGASALTLVNPDWHIFGDNVSLTLQDLAILMGAAELIIGIALLFTGVATGIGLGLILSGGAKLATAKEPLWEAIPKAIDHVFESIREITGNNEGLIGFIIAISGHPEIGIPMMIDKMFGGKKQKPTDWSALPNKIGETCSNIIKKYQGFNSDFQSELDETTALVEGFTEDSGVWLDQGPANNGLIARFKESGIGSLCNFSNEYSAQVPDTTSMVEDSAVTITGEFDNTIVDAFTKSGQDSMKYFMDNYTPMVPQAETTVEDSAVRITGAFDNKATSLFTGSGKSGLTALSNSLANNTSIPSKEIENSAVKITGSYDNKALPAIKQSGKEMMEGLSKGTKDNTYIATNQIELTAKAVTNKFDDTMGIRSPSRVFKERGLNIIQGLNQGITSNQYLTQNVISTYASNIVKWFDTYLSKESMQTVASNLITSFNNQIVQSAKTTYDIVGQIAKNISDWFNYYLNSSTFSASASNCLSGFNQAIESGKRNSALFIQSWAEHLTTWFEALCNYNTFYSFGCNVIRGFNTAIDDYGHTSVQRVRDWGASISNMMRAYMDINSPSGLFRKFGMYTVAGYNEGILDSMGSSGKVIGKWADTIGGTFTPRIGVNARDVNLARTEMTDRLDASVSGHYQITDDGFEETMDALWQNKMLPLLQKMAEDVARDADKPSITNVRIGPDTITKAVENQKKANGYNFRG